MTSSNENQNLTTPANPVNEPNPFGTLSNGVIHTLDSTLPITRSPSEDSLDSYSGASRPNPSDLHSRDVERLSNMLDQKDLVIAISGETEIADL